MFYLPSHPTNVASDERVEVSITDSVHSSNDFQVDSAWAFSLVYSKTSSVSINDKPDCKHYTIGYDMRCSGADSKLSYVNPSGPKIGIASLGRRLSLYIVGSMSSFLSLLCYIRFHNSETIWERSGFTACH